jgi:hypothetical protein
VPNGTLKQLTPAMIIEKSRARCRRMSHPETIERMPADQPTTTAVVPMPANIQPKTFGGGPGGGAGGRGGSGAPGAVDAGPVAGAGGVNIAGFRRAMIPITMYRMKNDEHAIVSPPYT